MTDHHESIKYFNRHASNWDKHHREQEFQRIDEILSRIDITKDDHILDVACGTGILTNKLLSKGITQIIGIDISAKMMKIYKSKYPQLTAITDSFEDHNFKGTTFNQIIIFNAFPHFHKPTEVFDQAHSLLRSNGMLTIAHSMNREELNQHHRNAGREVKNDLLIPDDKIHALYQEVGFSNIKVEDRSYFFSSGMKV